MRAILAFLFLITVAASAQTTYSIYEEKMIGFANTGWVNTIRYDSLEIAEETLDSCRSFLSEYPNSFARLNVISEMINLTKLLNLEADEVIPLVDTLLAYDKLPVTRLGMGEMLIEKNLDLEKGREYVLESLPGLSVEFHKFRAYMALARSDISLGFYASAENNYEKALEIEPDRITVWYEYLSLAKMSENHDIVTSITERIRKIEKNDSKVYFEESLKSPNLYRPVGKIELKDLAGNKVRLSDFNGKVVLINRFSTYCGWCIKEFPTLQETKEKFPEVVFLFVDDIDKPEEFANVFFLKPEFSFLKDETLLFAGQDYFNYITGRAVPQTTIIDKEGSVRFDYVGYNKKLKNLLAANLTKLLSE